MAEKKYEITYAAITDKGERTNNEDYLGVGKDNTGVLCVLCDGLGGHGKGEVASRFVVEEMIESVCNKGVNVEHAIVSTQENLLKKQERENAQSSMKTTLTCLYIEQEDASIIMSGIQGYITLRAEKLRTEPLTTVFLSY